MTENLAARGEGLAGLVARLVVMRDGADADARLAEEDSIQQWEAIGKSFAFNESAKQLAALEAAAPAGTGPRQVSSDCLDQLREMLDRKDLSGADLYALNEAITALATPSPQAPAATEIKRWFCQRCQREHSIAMPISGCEPEAAVHET